MSNNDLLAYKITKTERKRKSRQLKKKLEDGHADNSTECLHFPEVLMPYRSRQSFGKTF